MRHVLVKWFVMCSLLLGLHARVLAHDPCEVMSRLHAGGVCHVEHGECPPGDPSHDGHCPAEHHNHLGICGHATPYAVDEAAVISLNLSASSCLSLRHEGDLLPDGPLLEVDIPPLI
jgi:hypothetical protein